MANKREQLSAGLNKAEFPNFYGWWTGDDLPLTWEEDEIQQLRFRTIRTNYLLGNVSEEFYRKAVLDYQTYKKGKV